MRKIWKWVVIVFLTTMAKSILACDTFGEPKIEQIARYQFTQPKTQTLHMDPQTIAFPRDAEGEIMSQWFTSGQNHNNAYCFPRLTNQSGLQFTINFRVALNSTQLSQAGLSSDGHRIFRLKNYPYLGILFDLGVSQNGNIRWIPVQNAQFTQNLPAFTWQFNEMTIVPVIRARYILLGRRPEVANMPARNIQLATVKLISDPVSAPRRGAIKYYLVEETGRGMTVQLNTGQFMIKMKSCVIDEGYKTQNIKLEDIYKREILNVGAERKGGNFQLIVNCGGQNNYENNHLRVPNVFVTFKGLNNTQNNGTNNLLEIEPGQGKAEGVSLRIKKQSDGQPLSFGEDLPKKGNAGQFQLMPATNGQSVNAFDVYYVNNGKGNNGKVKGGIVKAAVTFTLSYQ